MLENLKKSVAEIGRLNNSLEVRSHLNHLDEITKRALDITLPYEGEAMEYVPKELADPIICDLVTLKHLPVINPVAHYSDLELFNFINRMIKFIDPDYYGCNKNDINDPLLEKVIELEAKCEELILLLKRVRK